MAEQVLTDVGIWIDGFNYDFVSNSVALDVSADTPESTTFAEQWRSRAPDGLKTSDFSMEGFFNSVGYDDRQFASLGKEEIVMVVPAGMAAGDVAYIVPVTVSGRQLSGSIGDLLAFTYASEGDGQPDGAQVMDIREGVVAAVTTPRLQLGAIPMGQTLHVWVQVDQSAGELEINLFSAAAATGGTVAARATQSNIVDDGHYVLNVDGQVTDEYWYLNLTPTGTNQSFDIAAASLFAAQKAITVPKRPITPPTPGTVTVKGGLSADAIAGASEITIDGVNHEITYPAFTNRHVIIWRLETEGDIKSVVLDNDPKRANQVGAFTKQSGTIDSGGQTGSVWVSNQSLTFPTPVTMEIQ